MGSAEIFFVKRRQFAPFRRFCRTRKLVYAQYTRVFGTCKEPQKSIKFSPFYRVRGPQKILLYFWGEGANEQKTNKRIKRVCLFKRKICDAYAPSHEPVKNPVISSKFCRFGRELIFKHPRGCFFVGFLFRATRFTSFRAKIRRPRGKLCTRGEKAHTSKRASIIACNNVILKVQCAPHRPEGQQYKTKRFYIKSVLFRFAFRWICVKVIYKYRTAIKPPTHIFKTIPRKKTVYCYMARVSY